MLLFAFVRARQPARIREVLEMVYVSKDSIDDGEWVHIGCAGTCMLQLAVVAACRCVACAVESVEWAWRAGGI